MFRARFVTIGMAAMLGLASTSWAADEVDDRFYLAPLASYSSFTEDTFHPDEQFGGQFGIGKTLTDHLALELYAFHFGSVDLDNTAGGEMDATGYGLSALLFPARDVLPVFGIIGIGEGDNDFEDVAGLGDQDSDFVDLGVGFLAPLTDGGIALRGEYRYRSSDVDAPGGGEYQFRDDVVSLGLQIPLGSKPERSQPEPAPQPEPEPATAAAPAAAAPATEPLDSDSDGVIDADDRCPGTPVDTEVDEFGCPVEKADPIVLQGVKFEFGSDRLTENATDRLDNVVNALQASEDIDVRIEGHTDSVGSAAVNLRLSRERAASVKDYLVDNGIDAGRLETEGYGETRPVAPNTKPDGSDNPEGRAQNRRVELHVVEE